MGTISVIVTVVAVLLVGYLVLGRGKGRGGSAQVAGGLASKFKPGSKAWEAAMAMALIPDAIWSREKELPKAAAARKERLQREIAFLQKQQGDLKAVILAMDESPGKGYIGLEQLPPD